MPELPEVETTRLGLAACAQGARIIDVWVSGLKLRIPVPEELPKKLCNQRLSCFHRRGKYIVFEFESSCIYEDHSSIEVVSAPAPESPGDALTEGQQGAVCNDAAGMLSMCETTINENPPHEVDLTRAEGQQQSRIVQPQTETLSAEPGSVSAHSILGNTPRGEPETLAEQVVATMKTNTLASSERVSCVADGVSEKQQTVAQPCPCLLIHLGMSGWFCGLPATTSEIPAHSHMLLTLDNGNRLVFNDVRRFGLIDWCRKTESGPLLSASVSANGAPAWREDFRLAKMGVEPLEDVFDGEYLLEKASVRRVSVKQFLMDNTVVVGIGNIYAAEILFKCGVHPLTLSDSVTLEGWREIAQKTRDILRASIEAKGTTFRDFIHGDGRVGDYAALLSVYGRKDHPCRICETSLILFRQQGRSTVYCPRCQPELAPEFMASPRKTKISVVEDGDHADLTPDAFSTPASSVKRSRRGVRSNLNRVADHASSFFQTPKSS